MTFFLRSRTKLGATAAASRTPTHVLVAVLAAAALAAPLRGQAPALHRVRVPVSTGFEAASPLGWQWEKTTVREVTLARGDTSIVIERLDVRPDGLGLADSSRVSESSYNKSSAYLTHTPAGKQMIAEGYLVIDGVAFYVWQSEGVKTGRITTAGWHSLLTELAIRVTLTPVTAVLRNPVSGLEFGVPPASLQLNAAQIHASGQIHFDVPNEIVKQTVVVEAAEAGQGIGRWSNLEELAAVMHRLFTLFGSSAKPRRMALTDGVAYYAESPGTIVPNWAVLERGGRYFTLRAQSVFGVPEPRLVWPYIEHLLRTMRFSNSSLAAGRGLDAWRAELAQNVERILPLAVSNAGARAGIDLALQGVVLRRIHSTQVYPSRVHPGRLSLALSLRVPDAGAPGDHDVLRFAAIDRDNDTLLSALERVVGTIFSNSSDMKALPTAQ